MASTVLSRIPVVGGVAYIEHVRALPASFNAVLSAEPDNRYFRHAIAVIVNGGKAGYVAPEVAAGIFEQVRDSASPLTCPGRRAARVGSRDVRRRDPARLLRAAAATARHEAASLLLALLSALPARRSPQPLRVAYPIAASDCRRLRPPPSAPTTPSRRASIERAAMEVVTFMQQYWRLAGEPGFQRLDRSHSRHASRRPSCRSSASRSIRTADRLGLLARHTDDRRRIRAGAVA